MKRYYFSMEQDGFYGAYFTYMDKSGGTADEEYLKGLQKGEPRFFSAIMVAAREAMKENVKDAMRTFALMDE